MRNIMASMFDGLTNYMGGLQRHLQTHLGQSGDLKVLSLVVALAIFFLIRGAISFTVSREVVLQVSVKKDGVAVLHQSPENVTVSLKGSENEVRQFDPSVLEVSVVIDEVADEVRAQRIELTHRHVKGAGKLRVSGIEPPDVNVTYDREVAMTMLITVPQLKGTPLQGDAVVSLTTTHVKAFGPESKLQVLREKGIMIPTEAVDVEGKTQGFKKWVRVEIPPDSGISKVEPSEVEAVISITTKPPVENLYTEAMVPTATNTAPSAVKQSGTNAETRTATGSASRVKSADAVPNPGVE